MERPTVSVCMITYNHSAFIAQAIESVLCQKSNFEVELAIGDDNSTDDTRTIIREYQHRYPDKIKILPIGPNIGVQRNFIRTYQACTGEFVAILEGDDYWTDPTKLQRQVDALRANSDCAFCFHDAETFIDGNSIVEWTFSGRFAHILPAESTQMQKYTQLELAKWGWFIPTASTLFRARSIPNPLPDWFERVFSGDFTMQMLSANNGDALYLPRVMSRYRLHSGSIMETTKNSLVQNEKRIFEHKQYQRAFANKFDQYFDVSLEYLYFSRSEMLGAAGSYIGKLYYYCRAISVNQTRFIFHMRRLLYSSRS